MKRSTALILALHFSIFSTGAHAATGQERAEAQENFTNVNLLLKRSQNRALQRLRERGELPEDQLNLKSISQRRRQRLQRLERPVGIVRSVERQTQSSSVRSEPSFNSSSSAAFSSSAVSEGEEFSPLQIEVVQLVNQARHAADLPPLKLNAKLNQSAQLYAEEMAKHAFFSHTDLQGDTSLARIKAGGYIVPPCDCSWRYYTGENLGRGQRTAEEVVQAWINSLSHRENILHHGFTEMGLGYADGYWVQHFGHVGEWQ